MARLRWPAVCAHVALCKVTPKWPKRRVCAPHGPPQTAPDAGTSPHMTERAPCRAGTARTPQYRAEHRATPDPLGTGPRADATERDIRVWRPIVLRSAPIEGN